MYMADSPSGIKLEKNQFQKMVFIMNALEKGWTIKKQHDKYIFTKKHENKREIFEENYLERFILTNSTHNLFLDK
jgi:hypothetical protein